MKKFPVFFSFLAMSVVTFYSCKKDAANEKLSPGSENISARSAGADENNPGSVYVLNNAVSGNRVLVFNRASNGSLAAANSYATGGQGTGAGLGSQGSLALQERDGYSYLYAVNAGSNDVTVFRLNGNSLTWVDKISSHGTLPISVTAHENILYVLNAGDHGNISGFHISDDGHLAYLDNSTKSLSSDDAGPAQIQFNNAGSQLVVTEKNTNRISTYTVFANGVTSPVATHASVGTTPFGFGFDNHDQLIVTDAFGGAAGQSAVTAYDLDNTGNLSLIDGPKGTNQSSACWLAITNNGNYCYTANTGSGTISGYSFDKGTLTLLNANGVTATTGTTPGDICLSSNSQFLYNLNSGSHSISMFKVNGDGSLGVIGSVNELPAGAVGIVSK